MSASNSDISAGISFCQDKNASSSLLGTLRKYMKFGSTFTYDNWSKHKERIARDNYLGHVASDKNKLPILLFYEKLVFGKKYPKGIYDELKNRRQRQLHRHSIKQSVGRRSYENQDNNEDISFDIDEELKDIQKSVKLNNELRKSLANMTHMNISTSSESTENKENLETNLEKSKFIKSKNDDISKYTKFLSYIYTITIFIFILTSFLENGTQSLTYHNGFLYIFLLLIPDYILPFLFNNIIVPIYFKLTYIF